MGIPLGVFVVVQTVLGLLLGSVGWALILRRRQGGPWGATGRAWMLILFLAVVLPIFWQAPSTGPGARLRVVSVLDGETTGALIRAFTEQTGIECDVDPFAGGTQTTVELIRQGRIQPDIFLGGTVEIHEELAGENLSLAHDPPEDSFRIDRYDDPDHRWNPLYVGYLALVYRPLPLLRAHPPDWVTLIQPRWQDRIAIPSPAESGGGLVFLATQILRQPEESMGWQYLRLLQERGATFESRSDLPISLVASGEKDLGVAWAHDILRRQESERLPVEVLIPQLTGFEVGGVSILRWTRHAEDSRSFVNFLVGRKAAEIQVQHGYRVPLRRDLDPPSYVPAGALDAERTAFYDRKQVLAHRQQWVQAWKVLNEDAGAITGK